MKFWLALSQEERKRRIARQQKGRRWFWALGVLVLGIQVGIVVTLTRSMEAISSTSEMDPVGRGAKETQTVPGGSALTLLAASPSPSATPTSSPPPRPSPTATAAPSPTPSPTPTTTVPATGRDAKSTPGERRPSLTLSQPPAQVTEQSFTLTGTGLPGERISILYRNSIIAQANVDAKRQWQAQIPTDPLARGDAAFQIVGSRTEKRLAFKTRFEPWWLEAPLRLQGKLGEGYACAPTVLGMAMDYHHQLDPNLAAPATVEIVEALKAQGFIEGYGADARMLVDLSIAYGYSHSFFYREWSQAHLRQMLDARLPVIVNVRIDLSTEGYGHSLMVIGLSPDGERVMVNDPARGLVEHSWEAFDASWASFGPPYRHGLVVVP